MKPGDCVQDPEGQIWMCDAKEDWMCIQGANRGAVRSQWGQSASALLAASKEVWVEVTVLPSPRQKFLTRSAPDQRVTQASLQKIYQEQLLAQSALGGNLQYSGLVRWI